MGNAERDPQDEHSASPGRRRDNQGYSVTLKSAERQVKPQTHSKPSSNGATHHLPGNAAQRLPLSVWRQARKKRIADCRWHLNVAISFRSRHARNFGCGAVRRFAGWISRSNWRDVTPRNRCRKKLACDVALYISDWLRIAFVQFRSSESRSLMGIRDVGQWKYYAMERFKGILDLTVINSLKTRSPIPDWAAEKVRESWNVEDH
jgi:hypothetical protein